MSYKWFSEKTDIRKLKKGKFVPIYFASGFKDEAENLQDLFLCH
jgi:hypothetical protein